MRVPQIAENGPIPKTKAEISIIGATSGNEYLDNLYLQYRCHNLPKLSRG